MATDHQTPASKQQQPSTVAFKVRDEGEGDRTGEREREIAGERERERSREKVGNVQSYRQDFSPLPDRHLRTGELPGPLP